MKQREISTVMINTREIPTVKMNPREVLTAKMKGQGGPNGPREVQKNTGRFRWTRGGPNEHKEIQKNTWRFKRMGNSTRI